MCLPIRLLALTRAVSGLLTFRTSLELLADLGFALATFCTSDLSIGAAHGADCRVVAEEYRGAKRDCMEDLWAEN